MLMFAVLVAFLATVAFVVLSPNVRAKVVYGGWFLSGAALQFGGFGMGVATLGGVLCAALAIVLLLHHRFNQWA